MCDVTFIFIHTLIKLYDGGVLVEINEMFIRIFKVQK